MTASGTAPTAGGGVHSASRSSSSFRLATIGGQYVGPRGFPPVAQVNSSSSSAAWTSRRELEDVLAVLQEPVRGEQVAEVADLVPPAGQEPVVAEELVLLDVGEDRPRERAARRSPCASRRRAARRTRSRAARAPWRCGPRAIDVLPGAERADVPISGVRDRGVVEPAAVVVVEAVARGHVEPRVLDLLQLREPCPTGVALAQVRVDLLGRPALDERVDHASRASRRSSASGRNSSTSRPATICAMCWSGMSGRCALQSSAKVT